MSTSMFRWTPPFIIAALIIIGTDGLLTGSAANPVRRGIAYFEAPRSVGTPIEDLARGYTGFGLAAKIEGRLRLDTDTSLDPATRALIRRRLAREN